ncbi:MAG TPA: glutamate--cysteine ligase [Beijerinckiaceae bacterium]|nr:glutamate--cysteine ligase [Beijerinckiaceae bacterium]
MARDTVDMVPISGRADLVGWLEQGIKTQDAFRIGTEHEKFPFYLETRRPVPYEGATGIRAILEGLQAKTGWSPILEDGNPIGLFDEKGGGAISLEPGGQFELSGAPLDTLHQTEAELALHLDQVNAVAEPLGIGFLGLGMSPLWTRGQTPVMPKSRYKLMTAYMPTVGSLGIDMMYRTCTVQVNLDFSSEADMVKKLRVSLALQPLATALFANSPFTEGRPNGYKSFRSHVWTDTDGARSGMLPFAFEDGFGFERYVDYALDVPMYFVKRGDHYHDVLGASFRDLLAGRLKQVPGATATVSDWANHLSTIFPEVRLKRYLEMRGADAGSAPHMLAQSAFWVGLLYDQRALDASWDIVRSWTADQRQALRESVPRLGLQAVIGGRSLQSIGQEVLALSRGGLAARNRVDDRGRDESRHLDILEARVQSGRVAADDWLERFRGSWGESIRPVFSEARL